jgi:tyrosyl-tRNA synthetase
VIRDPDLRARLGPIARTVETVVPEADLLRKLASKRRLRCKFGIDITSTSVHIGNGIPLWNLRRLQDMGHQAVVILGDYTTLVGDPSGKDKTRPLLTPAQVEENARTWLDQIGKIVDLKAAEVRRNGEWFSGMSFLDVLRLADRMTVQQMLERDSFEKRMATESPISIREFLYCLMQGWDSVVVKADVELGGTDQTFNLGVGRRLMEQEGLEPQVSLISPLLEGTDGAAKMSKSLGNSIGLSDPPKEMFGKAMSISDAILPKYLRLASGLPDEEVESLVAAGGNPRDAKMRLAEALVARYHGAAAGTAEREGWVRQFSEGQAPEDMPEVAVEPGEHGILDLVKRTAFVQSGAEARRLVSQGGVALDDVVVSDLQSKVAVRDGAVLRVGKRRYARLRVKPK